MGVWATWYERQKQNETKRVWVRVGKVPEERETVVVRNV